MNKIEISMLSGLILSMAAGSLFGAEDIRNNIENEVLRLHIVANSDSVQDQDIKLEIRDEILSVSQKEEWFENCKTLDETIISAREHIGESEKIANDILEKNGFDYSAKAELSFCEFDEREYGELTVPGGVYKALRITLGDAEGKNWWCVLYPQMCLPYAGNDDADSKAAEEYFGCDEMDMMKNPQKYRFRLKCVEILKDIIGK